MADTKVSALTDGVTAEASDRIPVARDPTGTPLSRYITPAYIRTYLSGLATSWLDAQTFVAPSAGTVPIIAKGASGQTANLQEWRNSSNTALASVSAAGNGAFNQVLAQDGQASSGFGFRFVGSNNGFYSAFAGSQYVFAHIGASAVAEFRASGIGLGSGSLSWGTLSAGQDVVLSKDAADTMGLRRGGTAGSPVPQTFNVAEYYAGGSDYSRLAIAASATAHRLKSEAAGSGTKRVIAIDYFAKGSAPAAGDLPSGTVGMIDDGANIWLCANRGGTLQKVQLT